MASSQEDRDHLTVTINVKKVTFVTEPAPRTQMHSVSAPKTTRVVQEVSTITVRAKNVDDLRAKVNGIMQFVDDGPAGGSDE